MIPSPQVRVCRDFSNPSPLETFTQLMNGPKILVPGINENLYFAWHCVDSTSGVIIIKLKDCELKIIIDIIILR